jgi:hypothetical protein
MAAADEAAAAAAEEMASAAASELAAAKAEAAEKLQEMETVHAKTMAFFMEQAASEPVAAAPAEAAAAVAEAPRAIEDERAGLPPDTDEYYYIRKIVRVKR